MMQATKPRLSDLSTKGNDLDHILKRENRDAVSSAINRITVVLNKLKVGGRGHGDRY